MSGSLVINRINMTKKGRYALFCGEEFLFSVDEETLVKHALKEGIELSEGELEAVRQSSDLIRAREKAFTLLSVRDHGEKELYRKLQKDFDAHTCATTVARMKELGLLDDMKYALQVRDYCLSKGKSAAEIRMKLLEKGLDREITETVLSSAQEDETARIRGIIESRYLRKLEQPDGYQKVFAALSRKGFRSSDIRKALGARNTPEDDEYYE